jgi:hypothetical protein
MKGGSRFANVVFAARKCLREFGSSFRLTLVSLYSGRHSYKKRSSAAGSNARIDVINTRTVLLDEHTVVRSRRDWLLLQLEHLRPSMLRDHHCNRHARSPLWRPTRAAFANLNLLAPLIATLLLLPTATVSRPTPSRRGASRSADHTR